MPRKKDSHRASKRRRISPRIVETTHRAQIALDLPCIYCEIRGGQHAKTCPNHGTKMFWVHPDDTHVWDLDDEGIDTCQICGVTTDQVSLSGLVICIRE